ncbi:MAG: glycosyltransferase, partial [Syntrophobacteraceae bacterium]
PDSPRKPFIVYIVDDLWMGGAQLHVIDLAGRMQSRFQAEVVSLGPASNQLMARLPKGVNITFLDMGSIKTPAFWASFLRLCAYLRRNRPDIVHTFLNTASWQRGCRGSGGS